MYYEINVSKNGRHFFATAKRSITDETTLHRIYPAIVEAFPAVAGYSISVTKWQTLGQGIPLDSLK